jgi:UDP-glucose 4-epimerase
MKTALVTGGAGFVGTNLIKRLLNEGYEVVSIDNYSTGFESNHQEGAKYYNFDVSKITDFAPYAVSTTNRKFDVVYHLAAIARIQPSFQQPLEYFQANAVATFNIAMYCAKNNIPLQFAGSSSHHSGKFQNPYTFSKDVSEEIVMLCQKIYGLKATITRFYNVYGPHHLKEGGYCTVIGKWERAIELGMPITIYGDGTKRRDFTHIDDIVEALILMERKEVWGEIFELGRGINYSIQEVAEMFEYDNIVYEADKPGEAITTLCEDTKAKDMLGWVPVKSIDQYIKSYLNENINNTTYAK